MPDFDTASCGSRQASYSTFGHANHSSRMLSCGWFIDVFSGAGGVARAMRSNGFVCRELELKKGFDILDRLSLVKLLSDVRAGKIAGAMIASPCTSFSIAPAGRL
eukprot:157502-Pyramimonas_sp.AAC.1